ncbi:MAG: hypothetical protein E7436_06235 [Ruminococcaceae bacterium]|nr:hypothetical protein [Oscillospiraceae bacterium]
MNLFDFFNGNSNRPPKEYKEPTTKTGIFFDLWKRNASAMILMNIFYSLMRLVLIPGGLASAAMAEVTGDLVRQRHYFGLTDYIAAIKKSWRQALPAGLLELLLNALLIVAGGFYLTTSGTLAAFGSGCFLLATMIYSFMKYYIWAQIVLFRLPLKVIYKNALMLTFVNFKNNLLVGAVSLLCYILAALLLFFIPSAVTLLLVLFVAVCFFPGFKQLLVQYCIFPTIRKHMIDPYYEEHPDEDVEKRKTMGL